VGGAIAGMHPDSKKEQNFRAIRGIAGYFS
jgi:hypothetical protein